MTSLPLMLLLQAATVAGSGDCYAMAASQMALNDCATTDLKVANSRLATFISSYQPQLAPEQSKLFEAAQQSWEKFRRAECQFEASGVSGGSVYPMVFARCLATRANARLSELQTLAACRDGDYECPSNTGAAPNNSFKPKPLRGSA